MNKRDFLRTVGGASLGLAFGPELLAQYAGMPAATLAEDEKFWAAVRAKFQLTPEYINLENGYYCFQPEEVLEAFIGHVRHVNVMGSRYMRTVKDEDKLRVRTKLAGLAGCSPAELIITRNTTESLDTVISGFNWDTGDEAVMANQDYGAMIDQFKLQARRYGMVNRFVDIPMDPKSDDEVVRVYAAALTSKTRLLMIPHMVNITGHVLPVRAICDMAHAHGVEVMVDGAHAFAHLDFRIPDLHCDYYGASLHKWLSVPLGAGILYVKRDKIAKLWPLYGDGTPDDNIGKLNHTGTHPVHTDLGIENAIAFHEAIGGARKEARLRYLQRYWSDKVRGMPKIVLNTPADPTRSCGIANVGVQGIKPGDLMNILLDKFKVWTVAIDGVGVHGVRVTPQVYTTTGELDAFVSALRTLAA
ncbi:MAG: aminotransferase class V-fold PLP-dependent enzyme [Gemmatimonadetes bacterium]|nr:aminotransferase class V-fold PLP-dependent enzyme [Gemmatimonadota bacterium]